MRLINSVAILKFFLITYYPPIRAEVLLAFANLAECSVSSRLWQSAVEKGYNEERQ
jgi:hypothetical protein